MLVLTVAVGFMFITVTNPQDDEVAALETRVSLLEATVEYWERQPTLPASASMPNGADNSGQSQNGAMNPSGAVVDTSGKSDSGVALNPSPNNPSNPSGVTDVPTANTAGGFLTEPQPADQETPVPLPTQASGAALGFEAPTQGAAPSVQDAGGGQTGESGGQVPQSGPRVISVQTSLNVDGEGCALNPNTQFGAFDVIYGVATFREMGAGDSLRVRFYYDSASTLVYEDSFIVEVPGDFCRWYTVEPDGFGWDTGTYSLEYSVNDGTPVRVNYSIVN